MAGFASGSDQHPFTEGEASDAVRCIDRYVTETASEFDAVNRAHSTMAGDLELYRFLALIGNYTGVVCKALTEDASSSLKQLWTIILPKLDDEKRCLAA